MRIEHPVKSAEATIVTHPAHRLLDPQVCRSRRRRMRHRRVCLELFERRDQSWRVAGQLAGADVGQRLTLARDRRLHRLGDDRGEDQQREPDGSPAGCRGRRRSP